MTSNPEGRGASAGLKWGQTVASLKESTSSDSFKRFLSRVDEQIAEKQHKL